MTESQYRDLCHRCDSLLFDASGTEARVGNAWLHVVREHPVFLARYAGVFTTDSSARLSERFKTRARSLAVEAHQLANALFAVRTACYAATAVDHPCDVLFVSHALTPEHAGREDDFYFGSLPRLLEELGIRTAIALINHTRVKSRTLAARWGSPRVPRYVFEPTLPLAEEVAIRKHLRSDARALRRQAANASGSEQRIIENAARESTSPASVSAVRLGRQIRRLTATLRPSVIVTTFEGHGWERLAFAGAKQAHPAIQTVGYQHAALFRLQHAIRRSLGGDFDPDVILTSGEAARRQLQDGMPFPHTAIDVIGSERAVSGGRETVSLDSATQASFKTNCCVVLPEGLEDECRRLFDFSVRCAQEMPEMTFVWRLHPQMTMERLLARMPSLRARPANIRISSGTLEEDLLTARWALYRGTTAVIRAVGMRCRPLYLETPGEMSIDPLHGLHHWKATVTSPGEFLTQIALPHQEEAAEEASRYCESIFSPVDVTPLLRLVLKSRPGSIVPTPPD